jgi:hypothetical protein
MIINLDNLFTSLGIVGGNVNSKNQYDFYKGIQWNDGQVTNTQYDFFKKIGMSRYDFFKQYISEREFYRSIDDNRIFDFKTFYEHAGEYLVPITPTDIWILETGFWNDENAWVDDDFWIDGELPLEDDTYFILNMSVSGIPRTYKLNYTKNTIDFDLAVGDSSGYCSVYFGPNPDGTFGDVEYSILNINSINGVPNNRSIRVVDGDGNQVFNFALPGVFPHMGNIFQNRYLVTGGGVGMGALKVFDLYTNTLIVTLNSGNVQMSALSIDGSYLLWGTTLQTDLLKAPFPSLSTITSAGVGTTPAVLKKNRNVGNFKNNIYPSSVTNNFYNIYSFYILPEDIETNNITVKNISITNPYMSYITDETETTSFIYLTHQLINGSFLSKYRYDHILETFTLLWRVSNSAIITNDDQIKLNANPGIVLKDGVKTLVVFYKDGDIGKLIHFDPETGDFIKTEDLPIPGTFQIALLYDKNNW